MKACLFNLFKSQADHFANKLAVEGVNGELNYIELLNVVNSLAQYISSSKAADSTFIGLAIDASPEYVASLLAVNKVKCAFAPLGSAYPAQRVQSIISKTGMTAILANKNSKLIDSLKLSNHSQLEIRLPNNIELVLHCFDNAKAMRNMNDVAYLLSTSGSTGEPKLILGSESGLEHFVNWQKREFSINEDARCTLLSPVTFDVSLRDILTPLISGGAVVIPDENTRKDPSMLQSWLQEKSITMSHMVPTILRGLLKEMQDMDAAARPDFPSLKNIFLAGEALYLADVKRWFNLVGEHVQLVNLYGPSETSLAKLFHKIDLSEAYPEPVVPLGQALPETTLHILNEKGLECGVGEEGELCIQTTHCSHGYLGLEDKQAEVFLDMNSSQPKYLTGDLVYQDANGLIHYKGRLDFQVKLRGQRIELLEVESAVKALRGVAHVAAQVREDQQGESKLVVFVVASERIEVDKMRSQLLDTLPEYMVPSVFVQLETLPLNANGKIDRKQLPELQRKRPQLSRAYKSANSELEKDLVKIWEAILDIDGVGIQDNFFDLGGTSNQVLRVLSELRAFCPVEITVGDVFEYATIEQLAAFASKEVIAKPNRRKLERNISRKDIAIVGMAANVPGADDIEQFWQNLTAGIDSISRFSQEELHESIAPEVYQQDNYVAARGILDHAWSFDAEFFAYSKREAEILDPQQRVLLQLAYQALENANIDTDSYEGLIGVFAGVGDNAYYHKVLRNSEAESLLGEHAIRLSNEKDYVAPRIAHALNLKGMAISVHTACSTSLVAVGQAVEALRAGSIDAALCGGAYIPCPQESGHLYTEGGFASKDGHCRPFDINATGTLFSSGAGMVLLKRLEDAEKDGDYIYATIKGVGINNDGGGKMSFMSPSATGQAEAIQMAVDDAGIDAQSVDYIETHGTATPLGDPIEVEALSRVYSAGEKTTPYKLGAVKSNLGHLDAAAGVVGLIKTSLMLKQQRFVKTLHFKEANPAIPFEKYNMELVVEDQLSSDKNALQLASVSAFGVGGTNAHIVMQAPPAESQTKNTEATNYQVFCLSAQSESQLEQMSLNMQAYLSSEKAKDMNADSVAYTLNKGRRTFPYRQFVVAKNIDDAYEKLQTLPLEYSDSYDFTGNNAFNVAFLFPGQGSQYVGMGAEFYEQDPVYRSAIDKAALILKGINGTDIRDILYPSSFEQDKAAQQLIHQTQYSQLTLFIVGYALSELWSSKGVKPNIMIGHSIGEYVAAYLAGVFTLEEALWLVSERGRLMQSMPKGDMLSVHLSEDAIQGFLNENLSIAAVNGAELVVVAGDKKAVSALQQKLDNESIKFKLLKTSHAFHSHMMEPVLNSFRLAFDKVKLCTPRLPLISTVSANRFTDEDATSVDYWLQQIRRPVRFSQAIDTLWQSEDAICLELGPRAAATTLARGQIKNASLQAAYPSMGKVTEAISEQANFNYALGQLWLRGVQVDFWSQRKMMPQKCVLPPYPFKRTEYRLDKKVGDQELIETEVLSSTQDVIDVVANLLFKITDFDSAEIRNINFLEAGIDSLGLTQFSLALQKKYKVPISLSQMLNEYPTSESLGEYIYLNLANDNNNDDFYENEVSSQDLVAMMLVDDMPEGLEIGVDEDGNPHWYKPEQVDGKYYEKFKGIK